MKKELNKEKVKEFVKDRYGKIAKSISRSLQGFKAGRKINDFRLSHRRRAARGN
jgi:hypothetical protein